MPICEKGDALSLKDFEDTGSDNTLTVSWDENDEAEQTRRGTMYCFKSCSVNQN